MIEILPNWHPIFVHFTVALISIAVLLFFSVQLVRNQIIKNQCLIVARWNLWIGTGFALITVITGLFASNTVVHNDLSHIVMEKHQNLALSTVVVLVVFSLWTWWLQYKSKAFGVLFFGMALLLLGLLTSTAWQGAELVYRHGISVVSMPNMKHHIKNTKDHVKSVQQDEHQHNHH